MQARASITGSADEVATRIFLFEHIDAELARPYLEKTLPDKNARVVFDVRCNALVVTGLEPRMREVEAIVTYLDDARWYEPEPVSGHR